MFVEARYTLQYGTRLRCFAPSVLYWSPDTPESDPKVTSLAPISCQLFTIPSVILGTWPEDLGSSCCTIVSADTPITVTGCAEPQGLKPESCVDCSSRTDHCRHLCWCRWDFYITTSSLARWQQPLKVLIQNNSTKCNRAWFKVWQLVDIPLSLIHLQQWIHLTHCPNVVLFICINFGIVTKIFRVCTNKSIKVTG